MPRVAWSLTDNSSGSPVVYDFQVNPNTFKPPGRIPSIQQNQSSAPNGVTILFQGRDEAPAGQMGGFIHTEAQFNDINEWGNKQFPLILTDDQSTTWEILITGFNLTRLRRAINQWRYDYTIDFISL